VQHLGGSITDGYRININLRFGGFHFFFSHVLPPYNRIIENGLFETSNNKTIIINNFRASFDTIPN
jgi:hypothetical protein